MTFEELQLDLSKANIIGMLKHHFRFFLMNMSS